MYMMNPWRCKLIHYVAIVSWMVNCIYQRPILYYRYYYINFFLKVLVNFDYSCLPANQWVTHHLYTQSFKAILWEASEVPDAKAQGFFEGLPPDGFLSSEEELREVWNLWMGRIHGWVGSDHLVKGLGVARCTEGFGGTFRSSWLDLPLHVDIALDHGSQLFEPLTMWV